MRRVGCGQNSRQDICLICCSDTRVPGGSGHIKRTFYGFTYLRNGRPKWSALEIQKTFASQNDSQFVE